MAGNVVNIKACSPLKLLSGLPGKKPAICHYPYNFPLRNQFTISGILKVENH